MTELTIARLGHMGDGIASGPVYVSRGLPGEVVAGEIAEGRISEPHILKPSPHRVSPPCPHYRACGGCSVQHADDVFVAEWKLDVVRTALAAQGVDTEYRPVHTSPRQSRRRAVFSGRRTKRGTLIGFHARASDTIVDVPECLLVTPGLLGVRPALDELTRAGASRKGELGFTVTETATGADVWVSGGKPLDLALRSDLAAIARTHGLARLSWDDELVVLRAAPQVTFDGIAVVPPPGAFLQATEDGERMLRNSVQEAVGGAARIADLFAGCGTFALPLSRSAEVHAVEGDATLIDALAAGWRTARGLRKVTTETRDLFRNPLMPTELDRFDAVVIDPPRAGAVAQAERIAGSGIDRVAAVSCNPVSFARDAKTLVSAGFRLNWVQVVDQFRWSTHVELAAQFDRNHMGA